MKGNAVKDNAEPAPTPLGVTIRLLSAKDIAPIAAAFAAIGWNKPASQYERYLAEQDDGGRVVLVAFVGAEREFAGYLTIVCTPEYPFFRDTGTPEIQDFNVLPHLRRKGIGTRLMDAAERQIAARGTAVVGIGVGMTADYGAAQRLYVRRGYIPDGHGLMSHHRPIPYGETATVDDDLVLYFRKTLTPRSRSEHFPA